MSKRFTYFMAGLIIVMAVLAGALKWAERMVRAAERDAETSTLAFRTDSMIRRLTTFIPNARRRNGRCSYADVWSLSPPVEMVRVRRTLVKAFHVEQQDGDFELVRTPAGRYWIPVRDFGTLAETIWEQQNQVYEGAMASVQPGDVVLDCGANVGLYTRHALDRGARLVVAIEMAPEALHCLRRNLEKEIAEGRVVIYPKGVWNKEDELELSTGPEWASTASSVALNRGRKGAKVPLTTIDRLVAELNLPAVDFIKMDIEGAEMQALEGAVETVRRFRPRMAISTEHRTTDPDRIPPFVERLWPDYRTQCGPCTNVNGSIQPDVLFAVSK